MENFKDLGDGKIQLSNGMVIPLSSLVNIAEKNIKSQEELAERIAQQEYSREKLKHQAEQYKRIVESNPELLKRVQPFTKSKDDFKEIAEIKAKEKQAKLLS